MTTENDPHVVNILTSLGALHGPDNVARIAGTLADPGPVRELADAASEVLRIFDNGQPKPASATAALDRLRTCLYGEERS